MEIESKILELTVLRKVISCAILFVCSGCDDSLTKNGRNMIKFIFPQGSHCHLR